MGTSGVRRACARYSGARRFFRFDALLVGQQQRLLPSRHPGSHEYYLRGCIADGLRTVQLLSGREEIDPDRVGIIGQGLGGLVSLWTAAFNSQINTVAPVAPYPCNWERHVISASSIAASEVKIYLTRYPEQEETVWKTLSYFDPVNIAHRVNCASLFPLGLQGNTAPPQDSVGVYNLIEGEKELKVLPYDGHGAGIEELICWMQERLKP